MAVLNDTGVGRYCTAFVNIPSRSCTDVLSQDLQTKCMHVLINNMLSPMHNHLTSDPEHGSVHSSSVTVHNITTFVSHKQSDTYIVSEMI